MPSLLAKNTAITVALATAVFSLQAAAVQRTHVSAAFGSDSNTATNCTAAAPCRFFQAAMSVTDTNGEVVVLDSGGYGAATITQSVALIAPSGVYAGISVFSGANGVTIATAGVNVVLRGITINGQGGSNGVRMTAGSKLSIENCFISNLQAGINVSGNIAVRISDTVVRDNINDGIQLSDGVKGTLSRVIVSNNTGDGLFVSGSTSNTVSTVDVSDSTFDGNGQGVYGFSSLSTSPVSVSVRDSRINKNLYGILAQIASGSSGTVKVTASNNIISNNAYGILVNFAGTKVWASGNTISDNTVTGLLAVNGALFETAGNNAVRNNATDVSGTVTVVATR